MHSIRRPRPRTSAVPTAGILLTIAIAGTAGPALATDSGAPEPLTIETTKAFGPVPGRFLASGAISDSGTMEVLARSVSASGAPDFGISHLTIRFAGLRGTVTIKTQIVETFTADPLVLANAGRWAIVEGTGAYANLRGEGSVAGTADEHVDLISRTFEGAARAP